MATQQLRAALSVDQASVALKHGLEQVVASAEHDQRDARKAFQDEIERFLRADPSNFYVLGDVRYRLDPNLKATSADWRVRDINRLLARHRDDRPIEAAQREAERARTQSHFAIVIAMVALAASLVGSIADFPKAACNLGLKRDCAQQQ